MFSDVLVLPAIPNIDASAKWMQQGCCVAGGNEKGNQLNQLCDPTGVYVTDDQNVYVAALFQSLYCRMEERYDRWSSCSWWERSRRSK